MSIYEDLDDIPMAEQERFLALARHAKYPADSWLLGKQNGVPLIRLITFGSVEVSAVCDGRNIPVLHYVANESLGIRALMHTNKSPELVWRTMSAMTCLEFDGRPLRVLLNEPNSRLRAMFEHAAHVRELEIQVAVKPLFQLLPLEDRNQLFKHSIPLALTPGESLPACDRNTLYYVMKGAVQHVVDSQIVKARDDLLWCDGCSHWRAQSWAELLAFPEPQMSRVMQAYPDFAARLMVSPEHEAITR
ncbi:MAG: hypothetical protein Q9M09_00610 [Mariprofundaceae bacterium]|nr:hypothetical protein [Mariprofundaceae bacterium]